MGEEFEDEGRGDLVWGIGYADVEVWEVFGFDEIANDDVQFSLFWPENE